MSSPDIEEISENSRELDSIWQEQKEVLGEVIKMHKKLQATPEVVEKPGDNSLSRLKSLYTRIKDLSEHEVMVSFKLLSQLDDVLPSGPPVRRRRRIDGSDPKRKRMKTESNISSLQLEALKGEQVAARVACNNAVQDEWFVVKVMEFDRETKQFEVLDEEPGDDEDGGGQRRYKVPMSCIIPLPKKNNPSSAHYFSPGRHVLAVYPGTTTLYKATVVSPPRKRETGEYLLEFDDDEEDGALPQRAVPFYNVVPLPEGHRQ